MTTCWNVWTEPKDNLSISRTTYFFFHFRNLQWPAVLLPSLINWIIGSLKVGQSIDPIIYIKYFPSNKNTKMNMPSQCFVYFFSICVINLKWIKSFSMLLQRMCLKAWRELYPQRYWSLKSSFKGGQRPFILLITILRGKPVAQ